MIRTHLFYPLNYEAVNYPQTKYLCFSFWAGLWSRTNLYFGISTCYRYNKSALKLSKRTESNRPINFGRVAFYRWTTLAKKMSRIWGSNPQPTDYKSVALPIVLIRLLTVLRTEGVEPCVFGLWDQRVIRFTRPLCITILGNILNIIVTNPHLQHCFLFYYYSFL